MTTAAYPPPPELLLERDRELSALHAMLDAAAAQQAGLAVIEGRAGIGKSRLLAGLRERAGEAGFRTISARGTELEQGFPYGVVRQLFEPLRTAGEDWERWLAGSAAPARLVFDTPAAAPGEDDELRDATFATLHGLYWLVVNLTADAPLLVTVDDLHWVDRPSLRFLAYLAPRLEGLPILIATGLRTGESGTDPTLIGDVVTSPAAVSVQPGPLGAESVGRLVEARLAGDTDPRFSAACLDSTGGNPLLLSQLISSLSAEGVKPDADHVEVVRQIGPRAVSRTVLLRLARLPAEATAVARAVAVLGESAELTTVAAHAGLDHAAAAETIAALARTDILRREPPLDFVHPLVRDAIYRELPPGERELQHARAAEVLREAGASADSVATQLLMAPNRGEAWVVELLSDAARSAVRRGASDGAIAYLRRALEEPPAEERRPQLLYELGLVEAGNTAFEALDHLREAYETIGDPRTRVMIAFWVTRLLMFTAQPDEAAEFARRASADSPPEYEDERRALEALELNSAYFGGSDANLHTRIEEHWRVPEDDSPGAKMLAATAACDWAMRGGGAEECAEVARAALADGVLIGAENGHFTVTAAVALVLAEDDYAMESYDAQLADAHRRGSAFAALAVYLWRGWALWLRGDLREAEESLNQAWQEQLRWGGLLEGIGSATTTGFLTQVLIERGRLDEARTVLTRIPPTSMPQFAGTHWRRANVELLVAEGRHEEALRAADEHTRLKGLTENPAVSPWRTLKALALDGLGRTEEAVALAEEELGPARAWGSPGVVGRTLRILGTLEREEGLPRLKEAVEVLERSKWRAERARALAAYGAAVRRDRRPTEAREPLRLALDLAAACGAEGLVEQVRTELAAAGAQPRTTALSGVDALTASERRVADMAAEGQTNRDIAQALFVTPKTVEVHLSNAYRKLGIRSRRELAGALGVT
ncbi:MAG TPA: AAA family ATPase [Thermoleophilaceae bacterium]